MIGGVEKKEISEFNMAVSWLNRLNYIYYVIDEAKRRDNYHAYWKELLNLLDELSTELTEKEMQTKREEAQNIYNELIKQQHTSRYQGVNKIKPELYWKMQKFEVFLRKKQNEVGLLKKVVDDAMKALQ